MKKTAALLKFRRFKENVNFTSGSNGRHNKKSYFSHLTDFLAMAPYRIFFRALKTIIMPNFMLLTESEQFKHISALLIK